MGAPVLLPYQERLLRATRDHQVIVVEKSRRIGATWAIAADAVLNAAEADKGQDVFYLGYNRDMTREFIDACGMWVRAMTQAAPVIEEFLFQDSADRQIQAFRIHFASGHEIVALCSRPRSLRGRQGYVIIDEAAFHDDLAELLKAALALLMWGGRVLIISTHDGADNPFAELVSACRSGKVPYHLVRTTFDDAIADGLFRRICERTGKAWSAEAEREWVQQIRDYYGDAADEELDCVPRRSGGKYFSLTLLEARAQQVPVLRWACADEFVDRPDHVRQAECLAWCEEHLRPLLAALPADSRSAVGEDFGRSGDLTVMWPLLTMSDLRRTTPFVVELRNVPFREQETVLRQLCDHLPGFRGAALDKTGNGQYLAERARQVYGAHCVAEVALSEGWYLEHMTRMKTALEDNQLDLPADREVLDDFRAIEVIRGVPRVPDSRTRGATGKRHGDAAVAAALAYLASRELESGPVSIVGYGQRENPPGPREDCAEFL